MHYTGHMTSTTCNYVSGYFDSGDRGADMAEHVRTFHPDHTHVFGDSTYDWEQKGVLHIADGERDRRTPRLEAVQRCTLDGCSVREGSDRSGQCRF